MKRVALITWIGDGNYGTALQSFALHKKLELLGYNVIFPYGVPKKFTIKNKIKHLLQYIGIDTGTLRRRIYFSSRQKKFKKFINRNFNLNKTINSETQLHKQTENVDVFITGSDQIWNTKFDFNPFYFLNFAGKSKRIAYASSIGLQDFPEEHKSEVKRMLSQFSHIGLREKTAVKIVSRLLGRYDIVQVLDPTFLLDSNDWTQITNKAQIEMPLPKKYILCYLIGNNEWYKKQLHDVVIQTGITDIIIIPAAENTSFEMDGAIIYDAAGPLEFVKLIKNAAFVCTDSFHATAISINLNVDFVAFMRFRDTDKASQNSRLYDILSHYKMMNRIYNPDNNEWSKKIEFALSNKQLAEDRVQSLEYLVNSIEK